LVDQTTRTFAVRTGEGATCNVPDTAKALTINTTVVGPTGGGYLTMFPTGVTMPLVSAINFAAKEPALGNGAIVPLGPVSATAPFGLSVFAKVNGGGNVNVVIDVTGYFE
jgi:hypothetical protein